MDVSAAGGKIGDITAKIIIFDKKVKDTYNKYAKRINELIDDLEDTLNRLIQATESTIKIIEMKDEPSYTGKVGIVKHVDGINQLHGTWGSLAVIPGVDKFEILEDK